MREPNNQFDEHAISVYTTGGLKLGYLPKNNNLILSRLMDEGLAKPRLSIGMVRDYI